MDEIIRHFNKEDFNTEDPYKLLYTHKDDGFTYMQLYNQIEANASEVGFKSFAKMIKAYFAGRQPEHSSYSVINNVTEFTNQPLELYTGDWIANESGIMKRNNDKGMDIACTHPILPIQRLINIDDGTVKLRIAFKRCGRQWKEIVADKSLLFNSNDIRKILASKDVSVSDANASLMVQYLQDMDDINYSAIPEKQSVSHLGWTSNGLFSPYMDEIEFDGVDKFKSIFNSVKPFGDFNLWLEEAKRIRLTDSPSKIVLAASFASVIIKSIGKLNFIVHLWGGSEVGKTVALLLASSVWANPNDDGAFMQTFNGTAVGLELQAGFVNNLPLVLDEFQLVRDKKSFEYSVYMLCEGIGKTRGAKTGGLQDTATWKNCTITSGEYPITYNSTGGGAVNRIVEIECREKLFNNAVETLEIIRSNYGHAGKLFVTMLDSDNAKEEAKILYKQFYKELGTNSTDKQTMAAATILTADALATKWIFCDDKALTATEIEKYLHSKDSVDIGVRGFDYLRDYYVSNSTKFSSNSEPCLGISKGEEVRIIKSVYEKICEEGGFNAKALLAWMDRKGKLSKDSKGNLYKVVKINGTSTRCACINLSPEVENDFISLSTENTPFN